MIEIILLSILSLYLLGYIAFFVFAMLDEDITRNAKFIGTLLLISLVWPIAFTMYLLDRS